MKNIFITSAAILMLTSALDAQWTDLQSAELVIGQPDFTTYTDLPNTRTAIDLSGPRSIAIDFQHSKLYIGDVDNHRVLRYAYPITGNQPTAELVFGQSDFTTDPVGDYSKTFGIWLTPTAKQILEPMALAVHNGDLWVLDHNNQRIVRFSHAYNLTVNNPDADLVIGQSTFSTRDFSCTSSSFTAPWGMTIDNNGNLWVADAGNGRVLRFNDVSTLTNGASANGVLGQTGFNIQTIATTATQYQFGLPSSLYVDGTTLWVCDRGFNRVLKFNNAAIKPNGANADGVLGQSDYSGSALGIAPGSFNRPFGVCVDGIGNLYVSDQTSRRILIFKNAANKSNGAYADNVLGQASFYTTTYSYGDNSFGPDNVSNLAIDNSRGKLFVVDATAARVMQFASSGVLTGISPEVSETSKSFTLSTYPNPFNLSTTISFTLQSESNVSLVVFNGSGKQLSVLVSGELPAGPHKYSWDAAGIPVGVYMCKLQVGRHVEMQKLIILK
jgi:sugar lactone lactonase YvrE